MTNAPSSTTPRTSPRPRAGHPPAPRDTRTPGSAAARGPTLGSAIPTSIDIPAIDAHSSLLSLGQNPDGSIQVPPLGKDSKAGWYDNSPSPGQLGPAVILGHIDSKRYGPGIFFKLGALKPGDTITVSRNDQTTAIFQVDKVEEYPKTKFPTQQVYGNLDHAGLRLITCGGSFNPAAHSYDDNIVAYATLISVSHSA